METNYDMYYWKLFLAQATTALKVEGKGMRMIGGSLAKRVWTKIQSNADVEVSFRVSIFDSIDRSSNAVESSVKVKKR